MRIFPYLVLGCYALIATVLGWFLFAPSESRYADSNAPSRLQFTVVAPGYESATSLIAPFGPGFERDLLAEFCKPYDCDVRWTQAKNRQDALAMLQRGEADVAVGFYGEQQGREADAVPAPAKKLERDGEDSVLATFNSVLQGFRKDVAGAGIVAGPSYFHGEQVQVRSASQGVRASALRSELDLLVQEGAQEGERAAYAPGQGAALSAVDAEDTVQADASRSFRQFRLDGRSWALWEPFAVLVKDGVQATQGERADYHWYWRVANASLHSRLRDFWERLHAPDNSVLGQLEDRYYGYLPASVNPYAVADLMYILQRRLPRYSSVIAKASGKADINPLLFTAVIIQESRLDESTVSHTGVRGIMQLTSRTAEYLKVDRMDPVAAIGAGARYLGMLWKDLEPLELDVWDRWFFTLAAFNQGPRRLEGAMELSRKLGGTGRTWSELKAVYPLLTQKKYAEMVGQGVCRGQEAVDFVERVRMSYHILRGLVALERPEAQNLGPLLRGLDLGTLGF